MGKVLIIGIFVISAIFIIIILSVQSETGNSREGISRNLTEIQQDVQEESERLRSLSELTPDAAREVSAAIQRSRRSSLRQQIIISAVFFVLGSATTLGITLLVL